MNQIAEARQKERARTKQAERDWVDQIRVQRQQQLELQAVVEEVVSMGYDRDVVERIQLAQQHDSAIPLVRAVESESPKLRQAPLPKFVGISNPSSTAFSTRRSSAFATHHSCSATSWRFFRSNLVKILLLRPRGAPGL